MSGMRPDEDAARLLGETNELEKPGGASERQRPVGNRLYTTCVAEAGVDGDRTGAGKAEHAAAGRSRKRASG
jgi:hypothetical protein